MNKTFFLTTFMAFNSFLHAVPDKVLISDDHVVAASNQYQSTIFQYDPIGNLAGEISVDHVKNRLDGKLYNYSDTAQLMEIVKLADGTAKTTALDHDEFGRLTRMGDRQFQYDSFNMMTSFTSPEVNASYGYDPLTGLRSEKKVNHQTTRYVLDDSQRVIQELDQENKIVSEIIYGEKGPQTYIYKGQTYTYDLDSLGSVIALKNAKGEVVNRYSYDVWGDLIASEEQVPNAIRYRGEYQDAETRFYYLRGRYYDPATRQFTTSDPAEDGLNWNMYCEGNPVNYADPSGYVHKSIAIPGGIFEDYYTEEDLRPLWEIELQSNMNNILNAIESGLSEFKGAAEDALLSLIIKNPIKKLVLVAAKEVLCSLLKAIDEQKVPKRAREAFDSGKCLKITTAESLTDISFKELKIVEIIDPSEIPEEATDENNSSKKISPTGFYIG